VYYDSSDLSFAAEAGYVGRAGKLFEDLGVTVEVKNEARVHLWYKECFGYAIAAYESVEHATSTWPTTATSIGVRSGADETLTECAPFGLNDLLGMIVRPNKAQITQMIDEARAERWARRWPRLRVLLWND
jgi:hypothetical protein